MANILIVPDSFKGCMTSTEVADIIADVLSKKTDKSIKKIPIADGGEGSVDCILGILGGEKISVEVTSPEFKRIMASYGVVSTVGYDDSGCEISDKKTAIIEFAESSGITKQVNYRTKRTTSFGFGEQILHALNNGIREFVLCLGGSATTDAACGMAAALGAEFIYEEDYKLVDDLPTGESLSHIERIDLSKLDSRIYESKFTVMCDVENPLYGINGASYVYGPQKGATEDDLVLLDKGLQHVCQLVKETTGIDYSELSGGGAAGGAGFGCVAFLDAKLKRGIDMIMDLCGFDNEINDCELIITGEGKLDRQSMMGKVLSGIRRRSGIIPVISICGICDADEIMEGISVYEIGRGIPLEESIRNAPKYLAKKAEEINV